MIPEYAANSRVSEDAYRSEGLDVMRIWLTVMLCLLTLFCPPFVLLLQLRLVDCFP